ncbi:MAG: phosphoenolpyruvate carboxykinase (ATP) [Deltaproteobacteria bacterium]|nr:phosphoenolpyruvate carboxykinase (ATP) [Deltaproteobacteria bacterium]
MDLHPFAVEYLSNPTQDVLRSLTLEHTPAVVSTVHQNLVKMSRNKARKAAFTYIIAEDTRAAEFSSQLISPAKAQALIAAQAAYIEASGKMIEIQGFIGLGERAVATQWLYTLEGANIAAMQQILAFAQEEVLAQGEAFTPTLRVIYTPGMVVEGMPGKQAILVDLESYTTYVMGPDYFGESKKGALRMFTQYIYRQGGLVLHAGAKSVKIGDKLISMTIMGLSGTGKTTTTFSKQGEVTQPIQDDMVSIWPGGAMSITENGCFAKTEGLTEDSEPVIYRGTLDPTAWVENVYVDETGEFDFFKGALTPAEVARVRELLVATNAPVANVDRYIAGEVTVAEVSDANGVLLDGWDFVKWTGNGRSIIPMAAIENAADLHQIPAVRSMGILNRDEGLDAATPGIVRFTSPEQAAGYFMLGETSKTSAAGKEVGKTRSPFTQPFFPLAHGLQATRFSELAATMPGIGLWLMNTGFVGGDAKTVKEGVGFKVKIRHSSAMLEAMLTDSVVWKVDPDFGYEVVDVAHPANAPLLAVVPAEILDPAQYFAAQGRSEAYKAWVERMRVERAAFLRKFGVDEGIVAAVCR